jgi:hypothetical protein
MKLTSALLSSLVLVTLAGCSKPTPEEQKKKEAELAAALASAFAAPSSDPSAPAAKAASGGAQALVGNCTDKSAGYCKEFLGFVPTAAADFCSLGGAGVLTKGATPCSRTGIVGTCESRGPDSSEIRYSYKNDDDTFATAAENAKMSCSILSGVWIPASPPAAASVKGAAKTQPKKK